MQNPLENPIHEAPSQTLMNPENMDSLKKVAGVQYGELAIHVVGAGIDAIQCAGYDSTTGAQIALQSLQDQKPKDIVESRLITQGAALYANGMEYIARASKSNMQSHFESYANLAIKLLRLHNETIDALSRYRRGGDQKITVTHVAEKMAVVNHFGSCGGGL